MGEYGEGGERVSGEYVESGRQDGGVPHCTYTQPHVCENVCTNEYETKGTAHIHVHHDSPKVCRNANAHTHTHALAHKHACKFQPPYGCFIYRLCTSLMKKI